MSGVPSPLETFGVAVNLPRPIAEALAEGLTALWLAAHGRAPGGFRPDLDAQRKYFDPVATGKRLRSVIGNLPEAELSIDLPTEVALTIDGSRHLITPEGRALIELLETALAKTGSSVALDVTQARKLERELLDVYRDWGRHRLRDTLDYLGGGARPLQLPAIGGALTLLVNRSDAPERAVKRFGADNKPAQAAVDAAFFAPADAFSKELVASEKRSKEKERLISGWTLHEVTRRLPGALEISDDLIFVNAEQQEPLLELFARELARRKAVTPQHVERAFDALVAAFRARSGELAGFGMLFERPAATAALKDQLLSRFTEALARS